MWVVRLHHNLIKYCISSSSSLVLSIFLKFKGVLLFVLCVNLYVVPWQLADMGEEGGTGVEYI